MCKRGYGLDSQVQEKYQLQATAWLFTEGTLSGKGSYYKNVQAQIDQEVAKLYKYFK